MCPYYDPCSRRCTITGREVYPYEEEEFCEFGGYSRCPIYGED